MYNETPHQIEPELERRTPRPIRRRAGRGSLLGCIHIFILPHTLVGIGALLFAINSLLTALFGVTVPGAITDTQTRHTSKGGTYYVAHYNYVVDGKPYYHQVLNITNEDQYRIHPNTPVTVKVLPATPQINQVVTTPWKTYDSGGIFAWIFATFWDAIMIVIWFAILFSPLLARSLVINGTPTVGRIASKNIYKGKSWTYYVHYSFEANGQTVTGKMSVRSQDWDTAREGELITVLFNPQRPKHSVVYRFADYEVA